MIGVLATVVLGHSREPPSGERRTVSRDFAKAVFQLRPSEWQGPIQSGYGWHLVFIDTIEPSRIPAFDEVEPDVKFAWLNQRQFAVKETAFKAMRARYTVVVPTPSFEPPRLRWHGYFSSGKMSMYDRFGSALFDHLVSE